MKFDENEPNINFLKSNFETLKSVKMSGRIFSQRGQSFSP